jgi:hypothetical protein
MTDDPGRAPFRKGKRNPLASWAFIAGLLGAGALPRPDCRMPLGFHLLPLAAIFLAIRAFTRRVGKSVQSKTSPPDAEMESMAPENRERA